MVQREKLYPLTHPQMGIWLTESFYKGTSVCNIAQTIKFNEEIEVDLLQIAVNKVIEENEGIRLRMTEENGEIKQYISPYRFYKLDVLDFSSDKNTCDDVLWTENCTKKAFVLKDSDLFYFKVLKLCNGKNALYLKLHHLITDAWGMSLIVNQIVEYYEMLVEGEKLPSEVRPTYTEYILDEAEYKKSKRFLQSKEFWNKEFETPMITRIGTDTKDYRDIKASRKTYVVPQSITNDIKYFCRENNISIYILFLTVLHIYLSKISSMEDIVIGTVFHNRPSSVKKNTAGMFVNTVPFRNNIPWNCTFSDALKSVSLKLATVLRHQRYPYDLVLEDLRRKYKID
ncbi:MAG TPA: condensation domain-containing protein, partial [Clostridia bacterium]